MTDLINQRSQLLEYLLEIDHANIHTLVESLKESCSPEQIIAELIAPTLCMVGDKWEKGEAALSQLYLSAQICEKLVDDLMTKNKIDGLRSEKVGTVCFLDSHILGIKIVSYCLKASGYIVSDLGQGQGVDEIVKQLKENPIDMLFVSTLLLPSALKVKELMKKIKMEKIPTRVIVGGAPFYFDEKLWEEVGADGMGRSATDAVNLLKEVE